MCQASIRQPVIQSVLALVPRQINQRIVPNRSESLTAVFGEAGASPPPFAWGRRQGKALCKASPRSDVSETGSGSGLPRLDAVRHMRIAQREGRAFPGRWAPAARRFRGAGLRSAGVQASLRSARPRQPRLAAPLGRSVCGVTFVKNVVRV